MTNSPDNHSARKNIPGRAARLLLAAAIAFVPAMSALAQPQPTTTPAANGASATRPGDRQGITALPGGRLIINFQDAEINTVLRELSQVAGYSIVTRLNLQGRVNRIMNLSGVSPAQAVDLLNGALDGLGYYAIKQEMTLNIVTKEEGRPRVRVLTASKPDDLQATDELVTVIIPLKYASATQLRQDLQPLVNPAADFTANASSNSLMMTDIMANIKRVVEIVTSLDTHIVDASDVKVIQLEYATAADVARLINDLFRTTGQGGGGGGAPGGGQQGRAGGAGFQQGGGFQQQGRGGGGGGGQGGGRGGGRSDRNIKDNFAPVDPSAILAKVAALPITSWNYKDDPASRHIGPMAQDFFSAFGAGTDDKTITYLDEGGVALAAVQGLNKKVEEKDAKIQQLEKELNELKAMVQNLAKQSADNNGSAASQR